MASGNLKKTPFFKNMHQNETLEQFLDREVRPDTDFLRNCGEVINTVVRRIQSIPRYSVSHVVKGGSLGKGTGVREHSDVDLLVVLNGFRDMEDLVENIYRARITKAGISTGLCSVSSDLRQVYDVMKERADLRKFYAKCVAKVQVEFVKNLPARVKDLIRLFKYWKYTEDDIEMSSYALELIIMHVWRRHSQPNNFKLKELTYDVVKILSELGTAEISFDDFYDPEEYITYLSIKAPYVLDPANPFHNVVKKRWSPVNLNTFLGESPLYEVTITTGQESAHGVKVSRPDVYLSGDELEVDEAFDHVINIQRKGKSLMRKFDSLPEENPSSTLKDILTAGLAAGALLAFAAVKLYEYFLKLISIN